MCSYIYNHFTLGIGQVLYGQLTPPCESLATRDEVGYVIDNITLLDNITRKVILSMAMSPN